MSIVSVSIIDGSEIIMSFFGCWVETNRVVLVKGAFCSYWKTLFLVVLYTSLNGISLGEFLAVYETFLSIFRRSEETTCLFSLVPFN